MRRNYTTTKWGWSNMPKIIARVTFDKAAAIARIRTGTNAALTAAGNQAIKDTTQHVPKDQGGLQNSGLTNSDIRAEYLKFILRWDAPYAQYLFRGEVMYGNPTSRTYGPQKLSFTSAMAKMEWTKYAHDVYGKDWRAICQAAFRKEMTK